MKVLLIAHSSGIQGAGIALRNIVNGLVKANVDIVVTFPSKGTLFNELKNKGVPCRIVRIKDYNVPQKKDAKSKILFFPRLIRIFIINFWGLLQLFFLVKEEFPDIIHSNSGVIRIGHIVSKILHIPHVWHIREYQTDNSDYIPIGGEIALKKHFHDNNNHCVTITQGLFDYYELNEKKDRVIYDGVFSESYLPQINYKKRNYFLYIGALEEGKGIMDLLSAFESFHPFHSDFELWLAGRDNINICDCIRNYESKNKIKYLGFRDNVYELMQNATALIVPSFFEGFGFITAEAMINGCPVIGRDTTGTKEQFDNGLKKFGMDIGYRFSTIEELRSLLIYISEIKSTSIHEKLERAQLCAHQYTIERNLSNIINQYNRVL